METKLPSLFIKGKLQMNYTGFFIVLVLLCFGFKDIRAQLSKCPDKYLGNTWNSSNMPANFDKNFNQVSPENAGKWEEVERTRNVYNWRDLDSMYAYCLRKNIPFKLHTFVWGNQKPSWIDGLPQAEQKMELEQFMSLAAQRYPKVALVDVVNEPLTGHAPPSFKNAIGGDNGIYGTGWDWVVWSFEKARYYFPNAKLILNEYHLLNDYPIPNSPNTLDAFLNIVNILKSRGLIDGMGDQSHFYEPTPWSDLTARFKKLEAVGLDIHITEFDVNIADDNAHKAKFEQLFTLFWNSPKVKGVTLWGLEEGKVWQSSCHMVKYDGTDRPAFTWLKSFMSTQCQEGVYPKGPDFTGYFKIVAKHSGQAMTANPAGSNVYQETYSIKDYQIWSITQVKDGVNKIISKKDGKSLDIAGASLDNEAALQVYTDFGMPNQLFRIVDKGSGFYEIIGLQSGKVLEVGNASMSQQAGIRQYQALNTENQRWTFENVDEDLLAKGPDFTGYFKILAKHSGKAMVVNPAGSNVFQQTYDKKDYQMWSIKQIKNGVYKFYSKRDGKALDVMGQSLENEAGLQVYAEHSLNNQRFKIVDAGGGFYTIIGLQSGKAVEVGVASFDEQAGIRQYQTLGTDNQKWNFVNVDADLITYIASQSSVDFNGDPSRAFDGNADGDFQKGSVTHTKTEKNPWWTLDRLSSQSIGQLKIYNRTECCLNRLHDFYVFVSDSPFTSDDPTATTNMAGVWSYYFPGVAGNSVVLDVNRDARYIRVQIPGGAEVLSMAEVEITSGQSPTPRTYTGEWNFNASPEGWSLTNSLSGTLAENIYNLNVTASDPYMHSPDRLNIDAASGNFLTVRMKNNSSATQAELFWITETDGAYEGGNKHATFQLVPQDADFTDYTIDLSSNANWNGTIRQIRVDPSTAGSGSLDIDYIGVKNKGIVTGIEEERKGLVTVYPNPANNELNLVFANPESIVSLSLVNLSGIEVYSENRIAGNLKINLDDKVVAGIYVLNVVTSQKTSRYKLIVNR